MIFGSIEGCIRYFATVSKPVKALWWHRDEQAVYLQHEEEYSSIALEHQPSTAEDLQFEMRYVCKRTGISVSEITFRAMTLLSRDEDFVIETKSGFQRRLNAERPTHQRILIAKKRCHGDTILLLYTVFSQGYAARLTDIVLAQK